MRKIQASTIKLLPKAWRDCIDSLAERHNCPPELSVITLFAVANFAAQAITKVHPFHFGEKTVSEFIIVILPASGLKSTIIEECSKGADRFTYAMAAKSEGIYDQYEADLKAYKNSLLANSKTPALPKPHKPLGGEFMTAGGTLNGIIDRLQHVPFLGVFNPDAASFLANHSWRDESKAVEMASSLCKFYSGELVQQLTGVTNIKLFNRAVNMFLMVQPTAANEFLNNETFKGIGLHNRFLTVTIDEFETPDPIFSEDHRNHLKNVAAKMEPFHARIEAMLSSFENIQDYNFMQNKVMRLQYPNGRPNNELCLTAMREDPSTHAFLQAWIAKIKKMKKDEKYEDWKEYLQRAQEHLYKIAATMAAYDGSPDIKISHFECAAGLFEWFMDEKVSITPTSTNEIVKTAEQITNLVKRKGTLLGSKVCDFCRSYRGMEADQRDRVHAQLELGDEIKVSIFRSEGNGKMTTLFELV